MLRVKNNNGQTVMEIKENGDVNVLSEKLKKEIEQAVPEEKEKNDE